MHSLFNFLARSSLPEPSLCCVQLLYRTIYLTSGEIPSEWARMEMSNFSLPRVHIYPDPLIFSIHSRTSCSTAINIQPNENNNMLKLTSYELI